MESMAQRGLVSLLYGRKEKKEKNRKKEILHWWRKLLQNGFKGEVIIVGKV